MRRLLLFTICFTLFIAIQTPSSAQKRSKGDDDAIVTIRINGKDKDLETYMEDWGEEFGREMELLFDGKKNISIDFSENELDIALDNLSIAIEDLAESFAETIEEAVTNMTIELSDIDPDQIGDADIEFEDTELEDLIDEIEDRYDSEVENIDKMKIKIRENYVKIEMDVTLENGRKIDKVKIIHHD